MAKMLRITALFGLPLSCCFPICLQAAQADPPAPPLRPGAEVQTEIGPGRVYNSSLRLRRGESAEVVVQQIGVDVVVEVLDSAGTLLDSVDSPNGRNGDEPVSIFAPRDQTYMLRVRTLADGEPAGMVKIRLVAHRSRAATAQLLRQRRELREQGSAWLRSRSAVLPSARIGSDVPLGGFDAMAAGARILGLGEATHGSREFNDVRLSLVKRLVERHGYRLIALEDSSSRWRDLADYVSGAQAEAPSGLELEWGWIGRRSRGELLVWARQWNLDHPADRVRIIGVDPQDIRASRERLAAFLAEAYGAEAAAAWAPAAADLAAADEQTAVFGDSGVSAPTRLAALEALSFLHQDAPLLVARFGAARVQDALASARDVAQFSDFNGGGGALSHSRDWYMAMNTLAALAEMGGQAKAVYWGHNSHVSAAPTRWGPTGAVLRQALGCGYQAVATTFGSGAFVAQVPNDPEDRLIVSTLPEAQEETIESVIAGTGPGARLMSWGCGPKQGPMPQWLSEPRPLRWIGGLFAPDTPASATYRPYNLTEAFDGIVYFPAVTAEEIPPGRPVIPARSRAAGAGTP